MGSAYGAGVFGDAEDDLVPGVTGDGDLATRMLEDETPRNTTGVVCNGRRAGLAILRACAEEPVEVTMGTTLRGGGGRLCSDAERTCGRGALLLLTNVGRTGIIGPMTAGRTRVADASIDAALGIMRRLETAFV